MSKSEKDTKLPTRRSKFKYAALEKSTNLKTRQDEINDVKEYFNELSEKDKEWMNTFMEEYNNANFQHGKPVLHKSKKQKKDCYNKNNARNRCTFTREKAQNKLDHYDKLEDMESVLQENSNQEED